MTTAGEETPTIAVVGAGIVGMCCALYLQRAGRTVTVYDEHPPGTGASAGNAGLIGPDAVTPHIMPGILWRVPGMLMDPLGPLRLRWSYLPRALPWLLRMMRHSAPERVEAISRAMAALHAPAYEDLLPLLRAAGAEHLVKGEGRLELYQSEAAFERDRPRLGYFERRGVPFEIVRGEALRELEPALERPMAAGVLRPDSLHVTSTLGLVQALAAHFAANGGAMAQCRVERVEALPDGRVRLRTSEGEHHAGTLVVAAGAYSARLAAQLGSRVPLEAERGYNATLPEAGIKLRRPIMLQDAHFTMTPMDEGLRLAGTVEFAGLDAPPDYARADKLIAAAKRVFPSLKADGATRWMGRRPALPDSLPVIGPSPRHKNVLYAFGHGHLGVTGAATTGRLIAALATGERPSIDMTPYRVDRF